ncbi:hypothetical protein ACJJTC_013791 [Scirpophaga incertulas]
MPHAMVGLTQRALVFLAALNEIVDTLEDEDNLGGDIILFPPVDGDFTDDDSGDENDASFLHLPSKMLRSKVEKHKLDLLIQTMKKRYMKDSLKIKNRLERKYIIYHFFHLVE